MRFFSKLFKKRVKEETRIVTQETPQEVKVEPKEEYVPTDADYNWMLAAYLNDAITAGKLKSYQNVIKFRDVVASQPVPKVVLPIEDIKSTKEIEALRAVWKRLKYKCADEEIAKYMTK